jgi:hypothetical protein
MSIRNLFVSLCLFLVPSLGFAAFTGIVAEVYASNAIPGNVTWRVYAEFDNPTDQLIAMYGFDTQPMSVSTSTTFYQNTFGGPISLDINPAFFGLVPEIEWDSYFTLAYADNVGSTLNTIGLDTYFDLFEAGGGFVVNDIVGGSLFLLPGDPSALPDVNGQIMLGQFTTDGLIDLTLNLQWRDAANISFQEVGVTLSLSGVPGCMDSTALNYSSLATEDDGSCTYPAPSYVNLSWELVASNTVGAMDTYRVYANFTNPLDQMVVCYGQDVTPLSINTSTSFYQDGGGGFTSNSIDPAFFPMTPPLEFDSWVTIGAESGPNGVASVNDNSAPFEAGGSLDISDAAGGAWYVFPDTEPTAFPDVLGRVLLAQVTTDGFVDLTFNLQYRAQDGSNPQVPGEFLTFPLMVDGCMDTNACNYDSTANVDDGSCTYPGCNIVGACNYDSLAGCDDGSCTFPGCSLSIACNYDSTAGCDDGSCTFPGCNISNACNYDSLAGCDDGSCTFPGCNISNACNYDSTAGCDDGSCTFPGCNVSNACNYDSTAGCDDGSCTFPGCNVSNACNYDSTAGCDDGSCTFPGCNVSNACNFNSTAGCDDGSCTFPGCTTLGACNYDSTAGCDDGSCTFPGCTTIGACNYASTAGCDDGSCTFPGCTIMGTCNYVSTAGCDDGSCTFPGCTTSTAINYNSLAGCDDGSCVFVISGCTYPDASNYDSTATEDDGSCVFVCLGCTDSTALNYNASANSDDGSCISVAMGCTDCSAINYNSLANTDDGSCMAAVSGCTDSTAFNYDSSANVDNGGCVAVNLGCTNSIFDNYNPYANTDDGSCVDTCLGDFTLDGQINTQDLLIFLGIFGTSCN